MPAEQARPIVLRDETDVQVRRGGKMAMINTTRRTIEKWKVRERSNPKEKMTIPPTEINAAALKNSTTEKISPMMQQYLRVTFQAQ